MKRIAFALIAVIALSTFASAEVLTTAKTVGEGNMAIQGFYTSNSLAGDSASQFGPKLYYGVTKDIDIVGKLGMGSYGGVSASTLGIGAKMNFVKAEAKTGLDIGGYANYETVSITGVTLSTFGVGGIFGKEVKKDITLYGILGFTMLSYKVDTFPSVSTTALTFGAGIDVKVSKDLSLGGELTTYSADGGSYSTFALGGTFALQ